MGSEPSEPKTRRSPAEVAFLFAAVVYLVGFALAQTPSLFDNDYLEWDARALVLPALRWHGGTAFANDLLVDVAAQYATPLWQAVYWLGTLVTNPFQVSKLLPFALYAWMTWQAFCLGRRRGGSILGAACAVALVHCVFVWNRLAGGHARGFAIPLVVTLLRYTDAGDEPRSLATLAAMALGYPPAFAFAAPAYLAVARSRRAVFVLLACVSIIGAIAWHDYDARLGAPPTYAQAATMAQLQPGGPQPYYPLPKLSTTIANVAATAFASDGESWQGVAWGKYAVLALFALLCAAALRTFTLSLFVTLPSAGLIAAIAAQLVAYRLSMPDRMLQLSFVPVAILALPILMAHLLRSPLRAALISCALLFGLTGDGMPVGENLTDFANHHSLVMRWLAKQPDDVLIATNAERASYVMTYAQRRVLFAASLNVPFFYVYAREMERRMDAFYRAYYAPTWEGVLALRRQYGVDLVVVDNRDFGQDALKRSVYYEPWGSLARSLLAAHDPKTLALYEPPRDVIVYHGGNQLVVDLRKVEQRLRSHDE